MGKTKTKKRKNRTPAPTGLSTENDIENEVEEEVELSLGASSSGLTTRVLTAIEKLQSTRVEDKECGANAVAFLVESNEALADLLSQDVVKIAAPLLVDSSLVVRHSVAGALRNLSVCGGHVACQAMIDDDVLTPLVALLKQYDKEWTPKKNDDEIAIDSYTEIFIEAVNILWSLCENSDTAINIFNNENLLPILLRCLSLNIYGPELVTAVANCLQTVTEDNAEVLDTFKANPSLMEPLLLLLQTEIDGKSVKPILTKTLAAGICYNLHAACPVNFNDILSLLSETLDYNSLPLLEKFLLMAEKLESKNRKKGEKEEIAIKKGVISDLNDILLAKQIAFEIITNISCSEDSGEKWEDVSSNGSGELSGMVSEEDECDMIESNEPNPYPLTIPCDVHEAIVSLNILNKIGFHMFIKEDLAQNLEGYKQGADILKRIRRVQCRALFCLNNLASNLDLEDFGGSQKLYNVWVQVAQMIFKLVAAKDKESLSKSKELLDAGANALRAVLEKLSQASAWHHFQKTTPEDLDMLFQIEKAASTPAFSEPNIRANVVRVTSTMACLMGNSSEGQMPPLEFQTLIKSIGMFLLEVSSKDSELWVSAEAIDAIMDVFAEDHLDQLAVEIGLTEKLKLMLPTLKSRVNQKKKSLGVHYPVVMTAKDNLVRFIKYKSTQTNGSSSSPSTSVPQMDTLSR